MNYRGKDKLAEALKKGLLDKREKKAEPITETINMIEEQARFEEKVAKPTAKNIDSVAEALKPKRQPWAQKLWEENKPAPKPVAVALPAKKKITLELMKESVAGLDPTIDPNKKAIKAEVLAENISEINAAIAHNNSRNYKPAKTETLEEKVNRLEELLKKKLVENPEYNEDGRGRHKVNYVHPDKKNIGNDRFETRAEATRYANSLKKKGYHDVTIGESIEQLDELSGKTLSAYQTNAMRDLHDKRDKFHGDQKKLWTAKNKYKDKNKNKAETDAMGADLDKQAKKIRSRQDGVSLAYKKEKSAFFKSGWTANKQVKEEVLNEEAEPKHKFNKVLAKHGYVYKGSHTEKSFGGPTHDFPSHNYEHPMTGGKVHVWQQKGAADSYHTRHKQKNGITAPGAGDTKGQLDRHLERWNKYNDGLERSGLREDIEQINELKASTLGRYIRKSQKDAGTLPNKIEAERDNDRHWPEPYKHGPKLERKLRNRNSGMDRAERALERKDKLKESVEPLEELSAQTVSKYGDKAWLSKANAHIDRGGADYLDDDKARKTATKTIGKRERGLALAKNIMKKKDC